MRIIYSYEERLRLRDRISANFQYVDILELRSIHPHFKSIISIETFWSLPIVLLVILISINRNYCTIRNRLRYHRHLFLYHISPVLVGSQAEELSYILDWIFATFHLSGEVHLVYPLPKLLLICGRTARAIKIYNLLI